jgi:hypothetical protein
MLNQIFMWDKDVILSLFRLNDVAEPSDLAQIVELIYRF